MIGSRGRRKLTIVPDRCFAPKPPRKVCRGSRNRREATSPLAFPRDIYEQLASTLVAPAAAAALLLALPDPSLAEVIISEVVEGSAYNKAVLLTNRSDHSVDVSGWRIEEVVNGARRQSRYTFPPGTLLKSGDGAGICSSQASAFLRDRCSAAAALGINGNDAVLLLDAEGTQMDQFGSTSNGGAPFDISCISGAAADHTVVRRAEAVRGIRSDSEWEASKASGWTVFGKDTLVDGEGGAYNANTGEKLASMPNAQGCSVAEAPGDPGPVLPVPAHAHPSAGGAAAEVGVVVGKSCASPRVAGADRRRDPAALRIAAYNVEWLFDSVNDPPFSRFANDPRGAGAHVRRVADVIAALDADIVALAEVEDCSMLRRLSHALRDHGDDTHTGYLVKGRDYETGQDVALLTRVDPSRSAVRTDDRAPYPRGSACGFASEGESGVSKNMIARFDKLKLGNSDIRVAMVALHLKAFPAVPGPCAQREAQASVARSAVVSLAQEGYEVIVAGDLNDFDADIADAASSAPKSRVLAILKGTVAPGGVARDGGPVLRNVMEKAEPHERYTSWNDRNRNGADDGGRERSAIDHVLVTQGLFDRLSRVQYVHEVRAEERVSDHWPILITFGTAATGGQD